MPDPAPTYTIGGRILDPAFLLVFRTIYPIREDGALVAFLGMEHGWGNPWRLYPIGLSDQGRLNFEGFRPICTRGTGLRVFAAKGRFPADEDWQAPLRGERIRAKAQEREYGFYTANEIAARNATLERLRLQDAQERDAFLKAKVMRLSAQMALLFKLGSPELAEAFTQEERDQASVLLDSLRSDLESTQRVSEQHALYLSKQQALVASLPNV